MREDVYWLGPCPAEEEAVQVGEADHDRRAQAQCAAYIDAIRAARGPEPDGARLEVRGGDHEFGRYYEVAVAFDPDNLEAVRYAADCDNHAPTRWPGDFRPTPAGKRYLGRRDENGNVSVTVVPPVGEPYPLPLRRDLHDHSPTGFNYGYSGSGPAQLALALAADALGDDGRAQDVYQSFKRRVVATLEGDEWELTEGGVLDAVGRIERARGGGWNR